MIPVEVREKEIQFELGSGRLFLEFHAQPANSGTGIDDDYTFTGVDFEAGGIATVLQIVGGGNRDRSAHSPELQPQLFPVTHDS